MTSQFVKYDPSLFLVERAQQTSAQLGQFILGESRLGGVAESAWVPVPMASFTYNVEYNPDENGTLIYGSETGTVSYSWWEGEAPDKLYPSDRIRASYDGWVFFQGTVESTSITYSADNDEGNLARRRQVNFSANVAGYYAVMMSKVVSWKKLPAESALKRVQRWVKVVNF